MISGGVCSSGAAYLTVEYDGWPHAAASNSQRSPVFCPRAMRNAKPLKYECKAETELNIPDECTACTAYAPDFLRSGVPVERYESTTSGSPKMWHICHAYAFWSSPVTKLEYLQDVEGHKVGRKFGKSSDNWWFKKKWNFVFCASEHSFSLGVTQHLLDTGSQYI